MVYDLYPKYINFLTASPPGLMAVNAIVIIILRNINNVLPAFNSSITMMSIQNTCMGIEDVKVFHYDDISIGVLLR